MFSFALMLTLIAGGLLVGCKEEDEENINAYSLDLTFNQQEMTLEGKEEASIFNSSENMFTCLYFHLYPNAFREDAKESVVAISDKDDAFPSGDSYGDITINSVQSQHGNALDYVIEGEDKNILCVNLGYELYPDESAQIIIDFAVKLANINHRLGYGENTINLANFYPIACVYENGEGFKQDLYHSNGDPFYSDIATYDVKITYPSNLEIASCGQIEKSYEQGGETTSIIKAEKMRDFALVFSEKFDCLTKKFGSSLISFYGYKNDDNLASCLDVAFKAVEFFSDKFGDYPYSTLSVVKTNFVYGGMEYPSLVMISDKYDEISGLAYVIVHEIAHQWWYAVVGNDQYNHAWQDEGLAEASTLMFFKEHQEYGIDYQTSIEGLHENYKMYKRVQMKVYGSVNENMDRPLDEFATQPEYVMLTYTKGALMFNTLEEVLGQGRFLKALRLYYKNFAFSCASKEELIACFVKVAGSEMESFFSSWLEGKVVVE